MQMSNTSALKRIGITQIRVHHSSASCIFRVILIQMLFEHVVKFGVYSFIFFWIDSKLAKVY